MNTKLLLLSAALAAFFSFDNHIWAANSVMSSAEPCVSCHKATPGVTRGVLEYISVETQVMQIDFFSHLDVVKFSADTELKNIKSFDDLANYKKSCLKINFIETDGVKLATAISRFDLLNSLSPTEKITKDTLKKIIANQNLKIYDIRSPKQFERGHLPGAIPLPAQLFAEFSHNLPDDKTTPIVFYGSGDDCLLHIAFIKAKELGHNNAIIYLGGYADWSTTDYTIVDINWLKKAIDADTPHVLIDLRPTADVMKGHIKGAVALSLTNLKKYKAQFPANQDAPIIFYGPGSRDGAAMVISWGYRAVGIIPASFNGWQSVSTQVNRGRPQTTVTYTPEVKPSRNAIN